MRRLSATLLLLVALPPVAGCRTLGGSEAGGVEGITRHELRRHVEYLASDELAGRDTGEPGVAAAEEYIAAAFERWGLTAPPGREGPFLDLTLYRTSWDAEATRLAARAGDRELTGDAGVDFRPFGFSDAGSVEAPVVFAGYGVTSDEHDWDDYAGLDVTGKLVLVLRHEPGENDPASPFDGTTSTTHALFTTKADNARKHGARGMLLVTDPLHHEPADDLRLGGALELEPPDAEDEQEGPGRREPFLAVHVSRELAESLIAPSGRSLSELQRALDEGQPPATFPAVDAAVTLTVRRAAGHAEVAARNVAGFLEGGDPALRDQWIVIGAHHDHLGGFDGQGDTVFNGADDNASGVAGLLELAQAFAARTQRPRRSLLFVTFTGEERGLLGSRALVAQQLVPLGPVVFMLNLDMIGRNSDRAVQVFGDGFVRGLRELVESAGPPPAPGLEFAGTSYAGNSDHDAFYDEDVPFMFLFTGTHEDYHQLGDHADKLDYARMQSIVRLAYGVVDRIADAESAPRFVHNVDWLGVRVEVLEQAGGPRATVTAVDAGSRGDAAGLRAGDVITAFGGEALEDPGGVGRRFRSIEPGTRVALGVTRGGGAVTVELERARRGYLGVWPATADEDQRRTHGLAEDEGLVLRRVVPEGPAAAAGLREGDILIRIAGQPVGSGNLGARLAQIGAGETVQVQVIRQGQRIELPLTLGERPRSAGG